MKAKHPDRNCLSGYYGISVSAQFLKHRTIALENILLFLLLLFMYSLISTSNSSDLTVSVMKVSTSIALQRNTKHAVYITNPYAHQHSASFHNNYLFTKFLIQCFLENIFWLYLLIILYGDVETNPGPDSADLSSSCSSCSIDINLSLFEQNFPVVHYNVQSLLAKVDQLQMELSHFDVIAFSETWLSPDIQDDKIMFQNYQKPF